VPDSLHRYHDTWFTGRPPIPWQRPFAAATLSAVFSDPLDRILGDSPAAEAIRTFGRRAAAVDAPVLLLGESGTGKGILARAIHDASRRSRHPLIAVNCAAVPDALFETEFFGHVRGAFTGAQYAHKGLFEQANGGTLFLDEVGELPLVSQAKLLTTIEDRQVRKVGGERGVAVDCRIIAATACPLQRRVAEGRFRIDLYHRLRILTFTLPPLRQRPGDIAILAHELLRIHAARYDRPHAFLDPASKALLAAHDWPGNVRELANVIEAAVVTAMDDVVHVDPALFYELPALHDPAGAGCEPLDLAVIDRVLRECNGNRTRAAASLGIARTTLWKRLKRMQREALPLNGSEHGKNDD
jgi:transcriptional regulator with PAS, ATPase and Fis domain